MDFFSYLANSNPSDLQSDLVPAGFALNQVDSYVFTFVENNTAVALVVFLKSTALVEWKRNKLNEVGEPLSQVVKRANETFRVPVIKQDARSINVHKEIYTKEDQVRFLQAVNAPDHVFTVFESMWNTI